MIRINARPVRTLTFITDFVFINLAFYVAYFLRYELNLPRPAVEFHTYASYFEQQVILNLLLLFTFWQYRIWHRRRGEFWADEVLRIVNASTVGTALMIMYLFLFLPEPFSRVLWVWVPLCLMVVLSVARAVRRLVLIRLYSFL